jgi:hypothetical protein
MDDSTVNELTNRSTFNNVFISLSFSLHQNVLLVEQLRVMQVNQFPCHAAFTSRPILKATSHTPQPNRFQSGEDELHHPVEAVFPGQDPLLASG